MLLIKVSTTLSPTLTSDASTAGAVAAASAGPTSSRSGAYTTTLTPEAQAELLLRLKHQQDLKNLHAQYNPGEGIQTGVILAASLVICFLYVFYKSKCKRTSDIYEEEVIRRSQFDAKFFSYSQEAAAAAAAAAVGGAKQSRQQPQQQQPHQNQQNQHNQKKSELKRNNSRKKQQKRLATAQQTLKSDMKKRQSDAKWYQKRLREVWHSGKQKTQDWIASHRAAADFSESHLRLCQSNVELQLRPSLLTQLLLTEAGPGLASRSASNTPYRQIGSRQRQPTPLPPPTPPLPPPPQSGSLLAVLIDEPDLLEQQKNCTSKFTTTCVSQLQQQQQQAASLSPVAEEEACPLLRQSSTAPTTGAPESALGAPAAAYNEGTSPSSDRFEARALVHSSHAAVST